jgi:dephospho-CoA kinase
MMLFISGLTGVGKSSTLKTLSSFTDYILLPNRRDLTDQIIIPEVLQAEGKPLMPVKDRLERFRITAEYRKKHRGGILQALQVYLTQQPSGAYIFDNIRGLDECKAAVEAFPQARIIFLDAPPLVRLQRLLGRNDSFDHIHRDLDTSSLLEQLQKLENIQETFEVEQIAKLKTPDLDDNKLIDAVAIILAEQKNYNATDAAQYLKNLLSPSQLLYLDTSTMPIAEVTKQIQEWL